MSKRMFAVFMGLVLCVVVLFASCVDQSQSARDGVDNSARENYRIVASSMSTVAILDKLNVDLVGVPDTNLDSLPERYKGLPTIGMAMTPDIEKLKSLSPDYVFGPASLISDLLPKYEAANLEYGFLNLNNVDGMYKSIEDLGVLLGKEDEAKILLEDYKQFLDEFKSNLGNKKGKRVLLLMGLPGSYVVATENSYAGSLVEMAGGKNVYSGTNQQFLTVNTEDMLSKDPEVILRTSHALPEEVMKMFDRDFKTNDIWKHFTCVKNGDVYDLDSKKFGMSAGFNYKEALEDLKDLLYD